MIFTGRQQEVTLTSERAHPTWRKQPDSEGDARPELEHVSRLKLPIPELLTVEARSIAAAQVTDPGLQAI